MANIKGWKFLNPYAATVYDDRETVYPVPSPNEKWGPWFEHPEPGEADGRDCGSGGWHVMSEPSAVWAPSGWWPWFAEGRDVLGQSVEKARVRAIRLRRVPRRVWWRIIRLGWCRRANLHDADLREADLHGADLQGADLQDADLRGANLRGAKVLWANLRGAKLQDADLRDADLRGAHLCGADLRGADLREADLHKADLWGADLRAAKVLGANLCGANLLGVALRDVDLQGAILSAPKDDVENPQSGV